MPTIKVAFGGDTWTTDDLTIDEMVVIEDESGATWIRFNPFLSVKHARGALIAFLARSIGREEAVRKVGSLSVKEAVACFTVVPDDDLPEVFEDGIPKAEDAPETTGSSGPPTVSDGPLT